GNGFGLSNPVVDNGVTTWDCIYFGSYWQNDTNGDGSADNSDDKEPIKWRVLSVDGDDVFLLSDRNLSRQVYKSLSDKKGVKWETSTIRSWLNGYNAEANICGQDYTDDNFLDTAFDEFEQAAIADTLVVNTDNLSAFPDNGRDTMDKVYLLSVPEVMNASYGFVLTWNKSKAREAKNTAYIDANESKGDWWLRTISEVSSFGDKAWHIDGEGRLWRINEDSYVSDLSHTVRPALHLNLAALDSTSKLVWSYAGKITSDEREIEAEAEIKVTEVELSDTGKTLKIGEKYRIKATVLPSNAADKTLTYKSSDDSVASVSAAGEVEAKKAGTVTVTVTSVNGKMAQMQVTVEEAEEPETPGDLESPVEVTEVKLSDTGKTLKIGERYRIEATVLPSNAADKTLTYKSSDDSVASVSAAGEVEAKKAGTVTVTVTSVNGKTAQVQVTVEETEKKIEVQKVLVSANKMTVGVGEKVQLEAAVYPGDAFNKALTYKSSNNKVKVNNKGMLTARKTGSCKITISSSNNKNVVVKVTVKKKPMKISLNAKKKTLKVGKKFQIKAKLPKGTASYKIKYTSNKKSVVAVSQTGKVTAMRKGNAIITVKTYNGKKAILKIHVK
ncbi:MAG: Ig-like domain-containing protein, partial [Lachnospiraceae bacterium]|nr:Ig-like domain-containing protein [Lachnospiraceae bacterium]